jgi:iron complex outermembrane receptor protein
MEKLQRQGADSVTHVARGASIRGWGRLAAVLLATGPATVLAQAVLEEITVTARKVEESLQTAPVSVSAFTGDELLSRGVTDLQELTTYAPNVEFFHSGITGANSGQIYIRGVGQFDYFPTVDPGVGIYIDGVYMARSLGAVMELVDIERIEILRGPQGTLYGKNTVGGAINVISRKPGDEPEAYVEFKTGRFDRINAKAIGSLPIVRDVLSAKIALATVNADGYMDRLLTGEEAGSDETNGAQGSLNWTPADNFSVVVAGDYTRVNADGVPYYLELVNVAAPVPLFYNILGMPYDPRWITGDRFETNSTGLNFNKHEIWGIGGTITWEVAGLTVKSITGYRDTEISFGLDPDGSPFSLVRELDNIATDHITEEFQISGTLFDDRLNWLAGVYYLHEEASHNVFVGAAEELFPALEALPAPLIPLGPWPCPQPMGSPLPCLGGAGNPFNSILDRTRFIDLGQEVDSFAVYGQGTYDITDQLSLTYGVRYTDEEKDFETETLIPRTGVFEVPHTTASDSWDDVSHRIGLDFQVNKDAMVYFSAASGFKSGGFNGRARTVAEISSYDPETLWAYEIGLKSEWFDNRLRANAAFFYNDYTDIQFTNQVVTPQGTQIITIGNAGEAEIRGFELELTAVPVEALMLTGALGHLDAEYTDILPDVVTANPGLTEDNELIGSPEWTASASAEYTFPLTGWANLVLRADMSYRSKIYFDVVNTESVAQDGYALLNLRAALESTDDTWTIAVGGTNVTDKAYRAAGVGVVDTLGFSASNTARPAEWYLMGSYRF